MENRRVNAYLSSDVEAAIADAKSMIPFKDDDEVKTYHYLLGIREAERRIKDCKNVLPAHVAHWIPRDYVVKKNHRHSFECSNCGIREKVRIGRYCRRCGFLMEDI